MVEVTLDPIWGYRTLRNENPRMGVRGSLGEGMDGRGIGLLGCHLSEQGAEGECGGLGDDTVSEESQLVGSIVRGDAQLGIVHPTGSPIRVSTQRGLSLP